MVERIVRTAGRSHSLVLRNVSKIEKVFSGIIEQRWRICWIKYIKIFVAKILLDDIMIKEDS